MKISSDLADLLDRENGLVAVVVQEDESNEVLMLAWMNREALEKTLESHQATYIGAEVEMNYGSKVQLLGIRKKLFQPQ